MFSSFGLIRRGYVVYVDGAMDALLLLFVADVIAKCCVFGLWRLAPAVASPAPHNVSLAAQRHIC